MKKLALLSVVFILLAGCGLVQPTPQEIASAYYGPYPSTYQDVIKEYMKYKLFDPYSAVFEFPHQPVQAWMVPVGNKTYGWAVVCRINAKNRMGGYVGFQEHQFLLRDGQVVLEGPWKGGLVGGVQGHQRQEPAASTSPGPAVERDGTAWARQLGWTPPSTPPEPTPEEDQAVVLARAREKAARGETLTGTEWTALHRADPSNKALGVSR